MVIQPRKTNIIIAPERQGAQENTFLLGPWPSGRCKLLDFGGLSTFAHNEFQVPKMEVLY